MNNQILDNEAFEIQDEPIQKYRKKAILLDVIPILIFILSILFGNQNLITFSSFLLAMIYLLGGWYIFKGDQYRIKDITFVTISVLLVLVPIPLTLVGITITEFDWNLGGKLLVCLADATPIILAIYTIISIIWYLFHRNRLLETRLSLKLLSRIIILTLLLIAVLDIFFFY
jgi:hypothetical protein